MRILQGSFFNPYDLILSTPAGQQPQSLAVGLSLNARSLPSDCSASHSRVDTRRTHNDGDRETPLISQEAF